MKQLTLILLLILLVPPARGAALQISSRQPATAVAGETVTLGGHGWPEQFQLLLGETPVDYEQISAAEVRFRVPELAPGDYLISVATGTLRNASRFTLKLVAPAPQIDLIDPDQVTLCQQDADDQILVRGRHFGPGARVLLNDTTLPVGERDSESLGVRLPSLASGVHRIAVINPDGQKSLAATLEVIAEPRLDQLLIGGDQVVSYPIRILGTNFTPQSRLLVNGVPVSNRAPPLEEGDDRVSYLDCTTLLYQRYPLTGQPRELSFQVLNPDGRVSNRLSITAY